MKKIIISTLVLLSSSMFGLAQTATLKSTLELRNIEGVQIPYQNGIPLPSFEKQNRVTIDLAGIWKKKRFNADHDISLTERNESGYAALINESPNYQLAEFDDSGWEEKEIPSVENTMNEYPTVPEYYENGVWYRTKFNVSDSLSEKFAKLIFYSVNYVSDVWINGEYLGWHEGGYTPFAFDVSAYLNYGEENVIAIRVDNPPWGSRKDIVPFYRCDWFNYTGIIHDIYVEFSNQASIIRTDIVPIGTNGKFNTKIVIHNSSNSERAITAKVNIYDTEINEANINSEFVADLISSSVEFVGTGEQSITVSGDSTSVWENILTILNPKLWSPQDPNLYVLKVTLMDNENVLDEYYTQFGLRTLRTDGNKVLLNDHVIFLTGAARHEDHPIHGRSIPKEKIFQDMEIIDSSNINYLRTSHYPNSPYTYLIADRMGIAVMEEIPVWWFDNAEEWLIQNNERHIHEQMFREMVFKDYNRPSILFWSTSNECKEETNRVIYNQRIVNDLRNNYDDGRLITQSSAGDNPGSGDITQGPLDIAGWTLYFGIFHGSTYYNGTLIFLVQASAKHPDKPIIDTEFGYWSSEDNSSTARQLTVFNETFEALKFFSPLKTDGTLNKNGFLVGTTWWCVFDWYSHQHANGFQSMGLLGMDRETQKPVYSALMENYAPYYANGGLVLTDIGKSKNQIINNYSLDQNFPNPFNPATNIKFSLAKNSKVNLEIYDVMGQKVGEIFKGELSAGSHEIEFNNTRLSSGIYFYRIQAGEYVDVKKMILLK